jgi:drug/metabolite transporter (DMT)-like permease
LDVRGRTRPKWPRGRGAAPFLIASLIAFLFAYNTGRIAARKGRRAVPWAMLGLFFQIFGLLTAYFTPAKEPAFD